MLVISDVGSSKGILQTNEYGIEFIYFIQRCKLSTRNVAPMVSDTATMLVIGMPPIPRLSHPNAPYM